MAQISPAETEAPHRSVAELLLRFGGISGVVFAAAYIYGRVYLSAYLYVFGIPTEMVDLNPIDVAFRPVLDFYWLFAASVGVVLGNMLGDHHYPGALASVFTDEGVLPELKFALRSRRNKTHTIHVGGTSITPHSHAYCFKT